jgi:hypothetical protein
MVEETIYSILAAQESPLSAWNQLIALRIYPNIGIQNPPLPYVVYHRVSTDDVNVTCGYTGLSNYRIQFDVYSTKISECYAAFSYLHQLLVESALKALRISQYGGWESETKLYRVTTDYSIWTREEHIFH